MFLQPLLNSTRSVPLTLLVPFLALLPIMKPGLFPLGITFDETSKDPAWLIALGVFVYLVIGILDGIRHRDPERERILIRVAKMGRVRYLMSCLFWEALPRTLTATRLALLFSLVLAIVLEQLVEYPGVGMRLTYWSNQISYAGDHPEAKLIALMMIIALIGIFIDLAFSLLEARLDRWKPELE